MPRNGSGTYSPTAGVPVVSGTTISSTVFNNVIDDIGDEITASMPVSGVAPMTGVLRVVAGSVSAPGLAFSGDTDTGLYSPGANQLALATSGTAALTISSTQTTTWTAKATGKAFDVDAITDVASASTTDIGAAATSEVRITGTTTITSFGTSNAGIRRRGRFADVLTLTHNGTSLILPAAANITTAANDRFEALSLGSGNWIVTGYTKASGRSVLEPITLGTPITSTSGTSVQFTGIPTGVRRVTMLFQNVSTNGTNNLLVQIGPSGGAETSGYSGGGSRFAAGVTNYTSSAGLILSNGGVATREYTGVVTFHLLNGSTNMWVGEASMTDTGAVQSIIATTVKSLAGVLERIRVTSVGGADTFDSGSINIMYE